MVDTHLRTELLGFGEAMMELSSDTSLEYAENFRKAYAGDVLNTLVGVQRLGGRTSFLTGLADDPFSEDLEALLAKENVRTQRAVRIAGSVTGLYLVSSKDNDKRQLRYYRRESATSRLGPEHIKDELLDACNAVYSTGVTLALSPETAAAVQKLFRKARKRGIMTIFDPNYRPRLWPDGMAALDAYDNVLPFVDVVLPSVPDDTESVFGLTRPEQVVDYYRTKEIPLVVVKMGEEGCYLGYKGDVTHVPALRVRSVKETVGAGDAFNAGFIHGLINEMSLFDCARLGVVTSGLRVQETGTISAIPYRDKVYAEAF